MDMEYTYTDGQNNGRIATSKDWISGEEVSYTYDSLQRLASAATTGTQWGEAYSYDGFGNLTGKTPTKGSAPALSVSYNPATNQPYNGNYDANGNAPVGTWDIENRLVGQTLDEQAITWGYDPFGKRVVQYQTAAFGQPQWTFTFYDANGRRVEQVLCTSNGYTCSTAEFDTYFGGKLIAATDASGHLLGAVDRLGTVRGVATNGTWAEPTYFPYGEPRTAGGIDGKQQYGTYVRDSTASAQDYAGQRYYSNVTGRFFSPIRILGLNSSGSIDHTATPARRLQLAVRLEW
jgi:YD repeat-containing protein